MKNRMRLFASAAVMVLVATASNQLTASADHEWDHGSWPNGVYPVVANSGGTPDSNLEDAAYFWQDRGFSRGYVPPLPRGTLGHCDASTGYINTCSVTRGVGIPADLDGQAYIWGGVESITEVVVRVADDLDAARRQMVWRHEFGHALGVGHNSDQGDNCQNPPWWITSSVMRCDTGSAFTDQHDLDAVSYMYPGG